MTGPVQRVLVLASVVAGLLWDQVSHAAVFFFGAASALLGCAFLLFLIPRTPAPARR